MQFELRLSGNLRKGISIVLYTVRQMMYAELQKAVEQSFPLSTQLPKDQVNLYLSCKCLAGGWWLCAELGAENVDKEWLCNTPQPNGQRKYFTHCFLLEFIATAEN